MGVVNILKTLAQSSGPSVTGVLAGHGHFWVAFVVAGSLKAAYDVMLLVFFGGRVHPRKDDSDGLDDALDEDDAVANAQRDGASLDQETAAEQDAVAELNNTGSASRS